MLSMKYLWGLTLFLSCRYSVFCQGYLGQPKDSILHKLPDCTAMDNYKEMLVLNCSGHKSIFYFTATDSICDMYAMDVSSENADAILKKMPAMGFTNSGTKYIEPFLVSKHSNHQKFPSRIYTNGKVQYCFMPVSLNGKTAELNSIIIRLVKNK